MRGDQRLPQLAPGQVWLIEQAPTAALSALDRAAITSANVVIYDRPLEGVVAELLPPGAYAEPLTFGCQPMSRALSPRALQLAADGWSVVQLVEATPCWRERLQQAQRELPAGNNAVRLISKQDAERYRELGDDISVAGDDQPMTAIFGPLASGARIQPYPFTANGLAG